MKDIKTGWHWLDEHPWRAIAIGIGVILILVVVIFVIPTPTNLPPLPKP